jgi:hypothetical protein
VGHLPNSHLPQVGHRAEPHRGVDGARELGARQVNLLRWRIKRPRLEQTIAQRADRRGDVAADQSSGT